MRRASGYAPQISADATRVYYLLRSPVSASVTLSVFDLRSNKTSELLADFSVLTYDISPDETSIAFITTGRNGVPAAWMAALDRRSPPRLVAEAASKVAFAGEHLVISSLEGHMNFVTRIGQDGTNRTRLLETPITDMGQVSPDGRWIVVGTSVAREGANVQNVAVPVAGGTPRKLCGATCFPTWSADGRWMYVTLLRGSGLDESIAVPLAPGVVFPDVPLAGADSPAAWLALPGARRIDHIRIAPMRDPSSYVFTKQDELRNLFRVPIPR